MKREYKKKKKYCGEDKDREYGDDGEKHRNNPIGKCTGYQTLTKYRHEGDVSGKYRD